MIKRRLYGVTMGGLGAVMVSLGIASYLSHPEPSGLILAMGVLSFFIGLQSFSGASGEARFWMVRALGSIAVAYGILNMFIERREEFWAFLGFAGVFSVALIIFLFFVTTDEAKTLPPAKEDDEGV